MKYIDAEKLIKSLNNYQNDAEAALNPIDGDADYFKGKIDACKDIQEVISYLQQEQAEVDLDKFTEKIRTFQERYKHPESITIKGAMAFMARMFYQYPNVAKLWYESLPKATMD